MSNPSPGRASQRAMPTIAVLLALASVSSCRCIEHPLYDAKVNRFDTWYLGGGNTQFRPFRSVQYDPDAAFELELRHRGEGEAVVIMARLHGEATADLEGHVLAVEAAGTLADEPLEQVETLATFEHADDDLALATLDREMLAELEARGAGLSIRFIDEVGASARLDVRPTDLLDPRRDEEPYR